MHFRYVLARFCSITFVRFSITQSTCPERVRRGMFLTSLHVAYTKQISSVHCQCSRVRLLGTHRADSLCSPIIGACRDWAVEFLGEGSYWGRSPGLSPEGEGRQEVSVCSCSVSAARCGCTAACCGCMTACCRSSGARRPSGPVVPPLSLPAEFPVHDWFLFY